MVLELLDAIGMLAGNFRGGRPGQKSRDDGEQRVGPVLTAHVRWCARDSMRHVCTTVETQTSMVSMEDCCRVRAVVCKIMLPRPGSHCLVAYNIYFLVVLKDRYAAALLLELAT